MRRFAYIFVFVLVTGPVLQAGSPEAPPVDLRAGGHLVALAQRAMQRYLSERTPAAGQPIPLELQPLQSLRLRVVVSLRERGKLVGRSIQPVGELPRNVISGALKAMRSPLLPDRVSGDYLRKLTIEIEIPGLPVPVDAGGIDAAFIAGLTGLMLSQGSQRTMVLPGESYIEGMDAEAAVRRCIGRLSLDSKTVNEPRRWSIFLARHFVGQERGRVFSLYRGKVLLPPEAITEDMLVAAAEKIGAFLKGCQDQSGQFIIDGVRPSMKNHLYATLAMAKLARRDKRFLPVVNLAMKYVVPHIRTGPKMAFVASPRGTDQLAATAILAGILRELPQDQKIAELGKKLRTGLLKAIGPDGRFYERLDFKSTRAAPLADACMAFLALSRDAVATGGDTKSRLASAREWLVKATPRDAEDACWKIRVLVRSVRGPLAPVPVGSSAPPDEFGGFAPAGGHPTTVLTAMSAVNMAATLPRLDQLRTREPYEKTKASLLAARRFCYQMMYRRAELYFRTDASSRLGAVRQKPGSAKVTLRACAAAIEALLVK